MTPAESAGASASAKSALSPRTVLLTLGALSLGGLFLVRWIDHRVIREDAQLLSAVQDVRLDLATAHLWLEELVSGDAIERERIVEPLARATQWAERLSASASSLEDPGGDVELAGLIAGTREQLAEFVRLSRARLEGHGTGAEVGVGSALDEDYDTAFASVFDLTESLSRAFERRVSESRERSASLFYAAVAGWLGILGVALASLHTLERRRARAERALEESRARLQLAQKLEAVGRLAAGIAHDLNNYLGAIRAHADLLHSKIGRHDELRSHAEAIFRVVDRGSAMIGSLLDFTSQRATQPRVLDLNRALEETLVSVVRPMLGSGIALEQELARDLGAVEIDPEQLEQVVVNLIVNARDATPPDGGSIVVSTENLNVSERHPWHPDVPRPGEYVCLSIRDQGAGIPETIRDKIFEPFFTTKQRQGSSGLGLATVHGIVVAAGGGIHVASRAGEGSTFSVLLPRSQKAVSANGIERAVARERSGAGLALRSILLVEDDEEMRRATDGLLEAAGYDVTAVADPRAAVEIFGRTPRAFDLLVTDLSLPGMDGEHLVRTLRRLRADLPILFLSGHVGEHASSPASIVASEPLLSKPFTLDQLLDAIDRIAQSSNSRTNSS